MKENSHTPIHCLLTDATEEEEDEETPDDEEGDEDAAAKNKDMLGSVDKFSTTSMDEVIQVCVTRLFKYFCVCVDM